MSSSSRSRMSSRISGHMSGLGVSILILLVGFLPMAPLSQLADAAVLPTISVDDVTVTEGTGGTVSAVFHLSQDKRGKTAVRFVTSEGTAKAPADFITKTGRRFRRQQAHEDRGHHRGRPHDRRGERELLPRILAGGGCHDRGRPRRGDDHGQRRVAHRLRRAEHHRAGGQHR